MIALTFGALISSWLAIEVADPDGTPESWLRLALFHPGPKYLGVEAVLEIDGRQMTISRSVTCKPLFGRSNRWSPWDVAIAWYPEQYLVSQRLDDGSGVLIVVPKACNKEALPPSDFIPTVLWVNSVEHPTLIEAYLDPAGLRQDRFRVTMKSLRVTVTEAPELPVAGEFADMINVYDRSPSPRGDSIYFVALSAFEIPTTSLPENKREILRRFRSRSIATVLDPQTASNFASEAYVPVSRAMSGQYETTTSEDIQRRVRAQTATLGNLVAFVPRGEIPEFNLASNVPGMAYLIRHDESWCRKGTRCIMWEDERIEIDYRPSHHVLRGDTLLYQFMINLRLLPTP
jgi:hypothetical protein